MNSLGKKLFIALFGLMAVGAIGGVMVAGYAVVIQGDAKPASDSDAPSVVPAPSATSAN
jgi:hypothetical protein